MSTDSSIIGKKIEKENSIVKLRAESKSKEGIMHAE